MLFYGATSYYAVFNTLQSMECVMDNENNNVTYLIINFRRELTQLIGTPTHPVSLERLTILTAFAK